MAEIFSTYHLSLNELINAYLTEALGLSQIVNSSLSSKLLVQHYNYDSYLSTNNKNSKISKDFRSYISKKKGIIYSDDSHPFFKHALHSAHLSSCCELFNGHSYTNSNLETTSFSYIIQNWLSKYDGNEAMIKRLSSPLHTLDAVRTIQILRTLSLVTIHTPNIRQISLGAGPADKDIKAIHLLPKITLTHSETPEEFKLLFETIPIRAKNIVISDNDPQRVEQYNRISNTVDSNVIPLNIDTYEALAETHTLDINNKIGPRNFIVALRIDHRMLPNIQLFFKLVCECMDQSADLIITIGSGHTIKEFEGRINKINEIYEFLLKLKLNPTLIKLHRNGSLEQQRNSNSFSTSSITTYQILHCKLKRKILHKAIL